MPATHCLDQEVKWRSHLHKEGSFQLEVGGKGGVWGGGGTEVQPGVC